MNGDPKSDDNRTKKLSHEELKERAAPQEKRRRTEPRAALMRMLNFDGPSSQVTNPGSTPAAEDARGTGSNELPEPRTGDVTDGYLLGRCIGAGGMGVVYEAARLTDASRVAVKFLRTEHAGSPDLRERFRREALFASEAARAVRGGVCEVYEVREVRGRLMIVMAFVDGTPLSRVIGLRAAAAAAGAEIDASRPRFPSELKQRVDWIRACAAIAHGMHEVHVVHRDLKPSNIVIGSDGPVILDFGLACDEESRTSRITHPDTELGTPLYMAPEQCRERYEHPDRRTDIYALGVILYLCATGRYPFRSTDRIQLLRDIVHSPPPNPRRFSPLISPELADVCLKCLRKEAARRFQTAAELAKALG